MFKITKENLQNKQKKKSLLNWSISHFLMINPKELQLIRGNRFHCNRNHKL